jgi:hypothetical protein
MRGSSLAIASFSRWRVGLAEAYALCTLARVASTIALATAKNGALIGSSQIDVLSPTQTMT